MEIVTRNDWRQLKEGATVTLIEKKSRFIATVCPVATEEEATSFIAGIKKQYWDARHNCSAFVLNEGAVTRCSDDGEPSGTAGRPMLEVLLNEKVTGICVVVTRYFGGVLLGTGGLVRAYQGSVKGALEECKILEKIDGVKLDISCNYTDFGKLQYLFSSNKDEVLDTQYGESVTVKMLFKASDYANRRTQIDDQTGGRAICLNEEEVVFGKVGDEIIFF